MPVLEKFNTSAAVNDAEWIFVPEGRTFTIQQTGLSTGQSVDIHIQAAIGTEPLYINGDAVQLTPTHMITPIHGPCRFKPVKGSTTAVRLELLTGQMP